MPDTEGIKVYAGLSMKVNIGNYENQDLSFGISGIPFDAAQNPEFLQSILANGQLTIDRAMGVMAQEMIRILQDKFDRLP